MPAEFTTKYWIVVSVLALVLLVGTGALSVWICKLYDTQKSATLPPGLSPFPDVVPIVDPPSTDPTVNTCYKWCGNTLCTDTKPVSCSTDLDCQNQCTPPNSVTNSAVCTKGGVCGPPMQTCITGFSEPTADPSVLKPCITKTDCNVCTDIPPGEQMNCVYVEEASSVTLCDGNCLIEGVPGGYYCLPERTGCNAKAGTATWSDQGWTCKCTWEHILGGPECNIMYACKNNMVTDGSNGSNNDTRALQQLIVNCNDSSNPLCGQPWTPETGIDPTACYNKNLGFGQAVDCNSTNPEDAPTPNCVCQCDGTDKLTNKGYTYDLNNPLTCVLDPCSSGAWGRTLTGDAGYELNAIPGVVHSLYIPALKQYLSLAPDDVLKLASTATTKFGLFNKGLIKGFYLLSDPDNAWSANCTLATNADGSKVGDAGIFQESVSPGSDSQTWVLFSLSELQRGTNNLDNLVLYNPQWKRPAGAQYSDARYMDENRYLVYDSTHNAFTLGSLSAAVILQRLESKTVNNTDYIEQPMTNCACSGANSVSSMPACFDDNDNFVNFTSLMNSDDQSKCNAQYSRNVSSICDPSVIPNSVVTVQPSQDGPTQALCALYKKDLQVLKSGQPLITSTNLIPFRSGFVPGLNKFIDPETGVEEMKSVCTVDPCTGKYGDAAYSLQNNSGFWDALNGTCQCTNANTDTPSVNYFPFAVDDLSKIWNKSCTDDSTSTACVCNHITNPVCAVCQNACAGSSFCKNSPDYPCDSSNLSCETDPTTGGADCKCLGNCINIAPDMCMARISAGGICTGVEGKPNVCVDGYTCKAMEEMYASYSFDVGSGTYTYSCNPVSTVNNPNVSVSYCTASSEKRCWNAKDPRNDIDGTKYNACTDYDHYETCPGTS